MLKTIFAHLLHAALLLAPSLLIAGPAGFDWPIALFACGVITAAILEGLFTSEPTNRPRVGARVRDQAAIRVAHVVGVALLVIFYAAQLEHLARGSAPPALSLCGALLLALGVTLRLLAIRALGCRFVSDIRIDAPIVRRGIYTHLRHPSELGLLLIAVGAPLILGSPLTSAAALLTLAPVSIWRMQREDKALHTWRTANQPAVAET